MEDVASVLELQKGTAAAGAAVQQDDILMLLDGLVKRREAAMREDFRTETELHLQVRQPGTGELEETDFRVVYCNLPRMLNLQY